MTSNAKASQIDQFDPNGPGKPGSLFGLPFDEKTAELVIIPVPWEVTVSYRAGTANGPAAILEASAQVDLFIPDIPEAWKMGMALLPSPPTLEEENQKYRDLAVSYINWLESESGLISAGMKVIPRAVDELAEKLQIYIRTTAETYIKQGKMVALLGGDHSTPLGLMQAVSKHYKSFGILQIDAHADLRKAYEDFTYSHASIMYNALELQQVSRLVQVGIRDLCEEEDIRIRESEERIITYYDSDLKEEQFLGKTWKEQCEAIVANLPELVYISFDIDGLDPRYCPNTGTPVPGGLDFSQVMYLFRVLVRSGRKIIAFDLNEVAPGEDEWDANVGARILYQLGCLMGVSQGKLKFK
ncbi:MAG: agmatinase family protein [Cyclobacteriaceae bacterium]